MLRNATWTLSNFCRGKNPQRECSLASRLYRQSLQMLTPSRRPRRPRSDSRLGIGEPSCLSRSYGNSITDSLLRAGLQISPALSVLTKLIYSLDDEVLIDACWAISYLSDGSSDKIQAVIESGVVRRLVDLLM